MRTLILSSGIALLLFGCAELAPKAPPPSQGHISVEPPPAGGGDIPDLVEQAVPDLPEPAPAAPQEKYTVVVHEVPVNELLFALARDAKVNVDIDPRVQGIVTLNAVDQTLPQLLDRVARQVALRYELVDGNLYITPDEPFLKTYTVDYVNIAREARSQTTVATQMGSSGSGGGGGSSGGGGGSSSGGAGGGNNSTTELSSESKNDFWASLIAGVRAIVGQAPGTSVAANVETGLLMVKATDRQHREVQSFLDQALSSAHRQVLIQVTITEVRLSDVYQAGIDWQFVNQSAGKAGFDVISSTLGGVPLGTASSFILDYTDPDPDRALPIRATLRLLEEFGDVNVLSSPQLVVLNNQTAVLKVAENVVYFEVNVEPGAVSQGGVGEPVVETNPVTVPVGLVMTVTPQISDNSSVTLNVRPTISRITDFIPDPNPELGSISNEIPQIRVREMESILRVFDGQIAVLGGLMEDEANNANTAIPGLSKLPIIGEGFKTRTRNFTKTELVIFIRPIVIKNPSLDGDLRQYRTYLERQR